MPKRKNFHSGFTLIEVMVAVMIVSVVIAALIQMQGNTNNKFMQIKKMMDTRQYNSFLLSINDKYGFEESHIDMNTLVEDFDLESDLRRKLKSMKVELDYEELSVIDTNEMQESDDEALEENEAGSGVIFEIGKSTLTTDELSTGLIRVRIQ